MQRRCSFAMKIISIVAVPSTLFVQLWCAFNCLLISLIPHNTSYSAVNLKYIMEWNCFSWIVSLFIRLFCIFIGYFVNIFLFYPKIHYNKHMINLCNCNYINLLINPSNVKKNSMILIYVNYYDAYIIWLWIVLLRLHLTLFESIPLNYSG